MIILTQAQIQGKIKRMAMEIYERHAEEKQIFLAGINNKGLRLAELLNAELRQLCDLQIHICSIRLNPAQPLSQKPILDIEVEKLRNQIVILCDDVCNTGRTLFFGFLPFFEIITKNLEVAVLVERMHKRYPINVNYLGIKLATTTKDNIEVDLSEKSSWNISLTE